MVCIDSANQNSRIDYIVIHATSENFAESLRLLTTAKENPVSAHYLIPETGDETYSRAQLRIYSLVPEIRRAWHAGRSFWAGESGLNDRSIGVELVNAFKCESAGSLSEISEVDDVRCQFPAYSEAQIALLISLLKDILARYPELDPVDVVGHSDIAIMRKSDPGPLFPWQRLYHEGIGAWPDPPTVEHYKRRFENEVLSIEVIQQALLALGYRTEITGIADTQTEFATRAFQLHFRAGNYSGKADTETLAILWALLDKYRPDELHALNLEAELSVGNDI